MRRSTGPGTIHLPDVPETFESKRCYTCRHFHRTWQKTCLSSHMLDTYGEGHSPNKYTNKLCVVCNDPCRFGVLYCSLRCKGIAQGAQKRRLMAGKSGRGNRSIGNRIGGMHIACIKYGKRSIENSVRAYNELVHNRPTTRGQLPDAPQPGDADASAALPNPGGDADHYVSAPTES